MWAICKWTYLYPCNECGAERRQDQPRLIMAGMGYATKAAARKNVKHLHKEDPSAQYFLIEQIPHRERAEDPNA